MGTLWRESRRVVNLAMNWVMHVEKNMCHVVKKRARMYYQSACRCRCRRDRRGRYPRRSVGGGQERAYESL